MTRLVFVAESRGLCTSGSWSDAWSWGRGDGRSRKAGGSGGFFGMPKLSRYDFVSRREGFALRMERIKSCGQA